MQNQTPHPSFADRPSKIVEDFKIGNFTAQAMDDFVSVLIVAYEQAVRNGVPPHCALAAMLDVASSEAFRLRAVPPAPAADC